MDITKIRIFDGTEEGSPITQEEWDAACKFIHEATPPRISESEFIMKYCADSGLDRNTLLQRRHVEPCCCDFDGCLGWGVVPNNDTSPQIEWFIQDLRKKNEPPDDPTNGSEER
jgi:hypothetical protein